MTSQVDATTRSATAGELAFNGLGKTFGKGARKVVALTDVNLTARNGEFIAFLGPSGCGKSTLLRLIMGLETVSTGTVSVCPDRIMPGLLPSPSVANRLALVPVASWTKVASMPYPRRTPRTYSIKGRFDSELRVSKAIKRSRISSVGARD